jgi:hypothetical protein
MIKKMAMEDTEFYKKSLASTDADFSKAHDSTERFANGLSLRRMGFPQEGLYLWKLCDASREMQIEAACGLTEPTKPECGAWGQGAEESPVG